MCRNENSATSCQNDATANCAVHWGPEIDSFEVQNERIASVLLRVRKGVYGPMSLVLPKNEAVLSLKTNEISVGKLLHEICAQSEDLTVEKIGNHVVVYPTNEAFTVIDTCEPIVDQPRIVAFWEYTKHLHTVDYFKKVVPPIRVGNPNWPIYSERVSLTNIGTVVQNLVTLLGSNPTNSFTMVVDDRGFLVMGLSNR